MTIRRFFIFMLALLLVSCSKKVDNQYSIHSGAARDDSVIQSYEYAIYSLVLDSLYADPYEIKAGLSSSMLIDSTIPVSRFFNPKELRSYFFKVKDQLPDFALDSLYFCFKVVNTKPTILSPSDIKSRFSLVMTSESRLDSLFGGTVGAIVRWDLFYKLYPHTRGLAHFSRVAFNSKCDQAVLYWEREREALMGYGEFIFLIKNGSTWHIAERALTWVS